MESWKLKKKKILTHYLVPQNATKELGYGDVQSTLYKC